MPIQAKNVDRRHRVDADQWAETGVWVMVKSSNVKAISYQKAFEYLYVEFKQGSVYRYDNVPLRTAKDMFRVGSKGKFVWRRLRDQFPYTKVL